MSDEQFFVVYRANNKLEQVSEIKYNHAEYDIANNIYSQYAYTVRDSPSFKLELEPIDK